MDVYWLGSQTSNTELGHILTKWKAQQVENESALKGLLGQSLSKPRHFLMELSEINEKKYTELKSLNERFQKKVKFIVFYQTLKAAPIINKLHGSEILLIGPEDRELTPVLLKRFFQNPEPLFRRWERYQVVTTGTLSLLSDEGVTQKISVSHFSAHGARVQMAYEFFKKKDFVVLEYVSHDGKKIRMQSRLVWTQQKEDSVVGGIQFISREV
jgi:hypothetical protein